MHRVECGLRVPVSTAGHRSPRRGALIRHFCPACGGAPFGFREDSSGNATVAVNVRCLELTDLDSLERVPFDGRGM